MHKADNGEKHAPECLCLECVPDMQALKRITKRVIYFLNNPKFPKKDKVELQKAVVNGEYSLILPEE